MFNQNYKQTKFFKEWKKYFHEIIQALILYK